MDGALGNQSFKHRRRYERRRIEVAAAVISGTRHNFEKAAEIGEGGMLLHLKNELPLGSEIQVQIILPDKSFITAIGEIIYTYDVYGKRYYGVEFLDIEPTRRGHQVGIICDSSTGDALTELRLAELTGSLALGVTRFAMPREPGIGDIRAVRETRVRSLELGADVLHGHGAKGGAYARIAAAGLRGRGHMVAAIYTPHGGSLHYHPKSMKGRFFMAAERFLARQTDGMLFESGYAARVYADHVGAPTCPVSVVHNGLRPEEFELVRVADDAADFVFVGELRRLKGVDLLIEAAASVHAERSLRIVIVGDGPDAAEFRDDVAKRGLSADITFPGALPAREAFRLGRVLLMPSRAESLPYVVLEAAAAGLPLIATNVGGIPEIVAGTDTPLIPVGDAAALAGAMRAALDNPTLAHERAGSLRTAVEHGFSVTRMTDDVLACYDAALDRRHGRSALTSQSPARAA